MTIDDRYHPFFRYGQMTNEHVRPIKSSATFGFTMERPFGLEKDVWGMMASPAYLSRKYVDASSKRGNVEAAYEITYRHHFNPEFDAMISYMYVENPAGGAQIEDPEKRITDANIIITRLIFKL